jgi:hypothetical protein
MVSVVAGASMGENEMPGQDQDRARPHVDDFGVTDQEDRGPCVGL